MNTHYRVKIEMTPVGHSSQILGASGVSISVEDKSKALSICNLLNESTIFDIMKDSMGSPFIGIKKSLRGEFNRLIVSCGVSKPLSKSQFESSVTYYGALKLDMTKISIESEKETKLLSSCKELHQLVSQLQG